MRGYLLWVVVLAIGIASGTWLGSTVKQGQWDASVLAKKEGEADALRAAAVAIANIGVKSEIHIQPVRTEIRTNTVYRDCKHSDDSLRNLNALITGEPAGGDRLPETKPTH